MSMTNNNDFLGGAEAEQEQEQESVDSEGIALAAGAAVSAVDLSARLSAMRRLSLNIRRSEHNTKLLSTLLHVFLFPERIMNHPTEFVTVADYLQELPPHECHVLKQQAATYINNLGVDDFSALGQFELLMCPWFLLTQQKLVEIEPHIFVANLTRDILAKMPTVFFREFCQQHPTFENFLTGGLLTVMTKKSTYLEKKQKSDHDYHQKVRGKQPSGAQPDSMTAPVPPPSATIQAKQQTPGLQAPQQELPLQSAQRLLQLQVIQRALQLQAAQQALQLQAAQHALQLQEAQHALQLQAAQHALQLQAAQSNAVPVVNSDMAHRHQTANEPPRRNRSTDAAEVLLSLGSFKPK